MAGYNPVLIITVVLNMVDHTHSKDILFIKVIQYGLISSLSNLHRHLLLHIEKFNQNSDVYGFFL